MDNSSESTKSSGSRNLTDFGTGVRPSYMAHFVLATTRLAEMAEWYKTVLNAWEVFRSDRLCFLTFDDEHHRLVLVQNADLKEPQPGTRGLVHVAYSYGSLGALLSTFKRLREAGISPNRSINHGPTTSFYYYDPDGTNVELQTDNFETAAETHAFMASDEFRRNPIGVLFDADALIRDYESGVPDRVLKMRPRA